jgi:hypothetical protein
MMPAPLKILNLMAKLQKQKIFKMPFWALWMALFAKLFQPKSI